MNDNFAESNRQERVIHSKLRRRIWWTASTADDAQSARSPHFETSTAACSSLSFFRLERSAEEGRSTTATSTACQSDSCSTAEQNLW